MMDEDAKNTITAIGSNLYQARRFFGLTMHDVADRTGLCRQTISKAENGDPGLSMETYVLIGKALDVPIMNDMQSSMAKKLPDHPMNRCVGYTRNGQRFVLKKNGEAMQICFRYQDTDYAIPMPESRISRRALGTVLYKKVYLFIAASAIKLFTIDLQMKEFRAEYDRKVAARAKKQSGSGSGTPKG